MLRLTGLPFCVALGSLGLLLAVVGILGLLGLLCLLGLDLLGLCLLLCISAQVHLLGVEPNLSENLLGLVLRIRCFVLIRLCLIGLRIDSLALTTTARDQSPTCILL